MIILQLRSYDNIKEVLVEKDGQEYFCTIFPNHSDYETIKVGQEIDGWIRIKGEYKTLVDYSKPERNWKDGERFI